MHGYALQRRLQNVGITVSVIDPGGVSTEGDRYIRDNIIFSTLFKVMKRNYYCLSIIA